MAAESEQQKEWPMKATKKKETDHVYINNISSDQCLFALVVIMMI